MSQLEVLSNIAKSEPQAAYSAFTAGFQHKLTYFIRTIPDLAEILKPLDDYINDHFLPALTEGHILSDKDRRLLSLPVRLGGLGTLDPRASLLLLGGPGGEDDLTSQVDLKKQNSI